MKDEVQRPEWKNLEILVAKIQEALAPGAKITHNAKLQGHESETERQIDVLVQHSIGQYPITIVIDCKDYKGPVDVKGVEEFIGLVKDVRAHQGAMVCPTGFTKSAKRRAKKANVALYSPVDTDPHKWQAKVRAPTVCEWRGASMAFTFASSDPKPFMLPNDFLEKLVVRSMDGIDIGTCIETALRRWNEGQLVSEPGEHTAPIFGVNPVMVPNGYNDHVEAQLSINYSVKARSYFGYLDIEEIRGLRDEQTGAIITNAFKTGILSPVVVENQWQRLQHGEEPPLPPALVIQGLDCFAIEGKPLPKLSKKPLKN